MKQLPIWFLTLALGFTAGFFVNKFSEEKQNSSPQSAEQGFTLTNEKEKQDAIYVSGAKQLASVEEQQSSASGVNAQLTLNELTEELEIIANRKAGELTFSEISRLYLLVANLSEDQVFELVKTFSIDSLDDNNQVFSVLFSKYVEATPKAAMDFVLNEMTGENLRNMYLTATLTSIAKQDPLTAYEHFLQHSDVKAGATDRNQMVLSGSLFVIFENLAKQDRLLAVDKLNELNQQGYSVRMPIWGLTQAFESKQEFVDLLTVTGSIDNHEIEETIINQWTRHAPEQVGAWLTEDYRGNRYNEIKENFIRSWSYIDREKSADWMVANSLPEKLNKNVVDFVQSWGRDNPQEAMRWFNQQPAEVYNQNTFSDFLTSVAFSQPQFATSYSSFINDEKARSRVAQSVYQGFKRKSSSKAEAFLERSPFQDEILKFDARMNR